MTNENKQSEQVTVNEYYGNEFTRSYEAVIINGTMIENNPRKDK